MLNEHLELKIKQCLLASDEFSSQPIQFHASNGNVTLRGVLPSFKSKLAVQQLVADLAEVGYVDNQITVGPDDSPQNDSTRAKEISARLHASERLAGTICVAVKDQKASLTGYVSSKSDRTLAIDLAASAAGVCEINDYLRINPDLVLSNQAHSRRITESISKIIGMEDASILVSVVDETAYLAGVVDAPWKREAAEVMTREFGILQVANDLMVQT